MNGPGYVVGKALLRALANLRAALGGAAAQAAETATTLERFGEAATVSLQASQTPADLDDAPETDDGPFYVTDWGAMGMVVSDGGGFPPTFNPHHWPSATSARDRVVLALMEQYGLDRPQAEALHAQTTALVERELSKPSDDTTPRGPRAVSFGQIQEKEDEAK